MKGGPFRLDLGALDSLCPASPAQKQAASVSIHLSVAIELYERCAVLVGVSTEEDRRRQI